MPGAKKRKKTAAPKEPAAKKAYVPKIGSANYAFLIVLYKVMRVSRKLSVQQRRWFCTDSAKRCQELAICKIVTL